MGRVQTLRPAKGASIRHSHFAGRLRDWWTNETVAAFEEKAQCIAKQYSKYYIVGPDGKKEHINGNVSVAVAGRGDEADR